MPSIKAGDINIEYYVEGQGPPLLLIMGFGGQANSWSEPYLKELRPHFTTIRFSNRGTGLSDKPQSPTSIRQMADDSAALLDAVGVERAHVLGASMGGMIAQELALNHPQKVLALVLACTNCGPAHSTPPSPEIATLLMPAPGLPRADQIRKAWPVMCTPAFIEQRRDFLEEMLQTSLVNPTPVETILKQAMAVQGFDSYGRLPNIKAPTLVVHGDLDRLVPFTNGKVIQERIPGARFRLIEGTAHMMSWEKPRETAAAVIEFLGQIAVPAA